MMKSHLIWLGIFWLRLLPEPLVIWLSKIIAGILTRVLTRRREIAYRNLERVFGESLPARVKRYYLYRSWQNLLLMSAQIIRFARHKEKYLAQMVTNNEAMIRESLGKGKGVILVSAHVGNYFLGAAYLAQRYPVHVIVRTSRDPQVRAITYQLFRSMGFHPIDRVGGVPQMIKALRENAVVIIAQDQNAGMNGVWADFFGEPASTFPTPITLALKFGAPVHIGLLHHHVNGIHEAWLSDPVELLRSGNSRQDLRANLQRINEELEGFIARYPDTWMWVHNRWKHKPVLRV